MGRTLSKKEKVDQHTDPRALEQLVDELMKDHPNATLVKKLSLFLGLPYSGDPMTQINTVLHSMSVGSLRKELER